MMHGTPTDIFPLGFINFENPTSEHEEGNRYFMIAIVTDVCQNYSNLARGYLEIWMLHDYYQLFKMAHTSGPPDSRSVLSPSRATPPLSRQTLLPSNAMHPQDGLLGETVVFFPRVSRWPWPNALKVLLRGMRGVCWDFMPQWEWLLKLTAMHMEATQRDPLTLPSDSTQINRRVHVEFVEKSSAVQSRSAQGLWRTEQWLSAINHSTELQCLLSTCAIWPTWSFIHNLFIWFLRNASFNLVTSRHNQTLLQRTCSTLID